MGSERRRFEPGDRRRDAADDRHVPGKDGDALAVCEPMRRRKGAGCGGNGQRRAVNPGLLDRLCCRHVASTIWGMNCSEWCMGSCLEEMSGSARRDRCEQATHSRYGLDVSMAKSMLRLIYHNMAGCRGSQNGTERSVGCRADSDDNRIRRAVRRLPTVR